MKKLLEGVGINDSDYHVYRTVNGKQVKCKYYQTWKDMLMRCYSSEYHAKYPTYVGCTVVDEWLSFMNFRDWMMKQDWRDKQLDKDFLFQDNKVYGPSTCIFVDQAVNKFITDSGAKRGEWPIGVCFNKRDRKFVAQCRNPFTNKKEYLGYHDCQHKAHQVWLKRKKELQVQLADTITDVRIKTALLRYEFN